jgi:hypothetical protein
VIVLIQAWGDKKSISKDWKDGHYVVCIGYSKLGFILKTLTAKEELI